MSKGRRKPGCAFKGRAGLERARAEGKTLGPPPLVDDDQGRPWPG